MSKNSEKAKLKAKKPLQNKSEENTKKIKWMTPQKMSQA